jgi:hypothetical protein
LNINLNTDIRKTKTIYRDRQRCAPAGGRGRSACGSLVDTASFVFRKVLGAFESGSFSFWFKSLLAFGPGVLGNTLLFFHSAISKMVG